MWWFGRTKRLRLKTTNHANGRSAYETKKKTVLSTMNMGMMLEAVKSNEELYNQASNLFKSFRQMKDELAVGKR